ncbi:hypothetical protein KRX57_08330 [Weeksellaceae bacterium TAE3-ERU29]|nr:hypothetical protein [Weeksellaceae bacterium TAE3-ERU29]
MSTAVEYFEKALVSFILGLICFVINLFFKKINKKPEKFERKDSLLESYSQAFRHYIYYHLKSFKIIPYGLFLGTLLFLVLGLIELIN